MGDIADMLYEQMMDEFIDWEDDDGGRARWYSRRQFPIQPLRRHPVLARVETKERLFGLRVVDGRVIRKAE